MRTSSIVTVVLWDFIQPLQRICLFINIDFSGLLLYDFLWGDFDFLRLFSFYDRFIYTNRSVDMFMI